MVLGPGTQKGQQERLNWPTHYRSESDVVAIEPLNTCQYTIFRVFVVDCKCKLSFCLQDVKDVR